MLTLIELLKLRGFEFNPKRTKLVRHKDERIDIGLLRRQGWLEAYQSFQGRTVFDSCDMILSFIGEPYGRSRFFGAFSVGQRIDAAKAKRHIPAGCIAGEGWARHGRHYYALTRLRGLEDFEDRLAIDWGAGTRAWVQRLRDKPVVEIAPPGRQLETFVDYARFSLTHGELKSLVATANAHPDWHASLRAVGAIYLIVNTANGQQYVGSATGVGGLWARWEQYAHSGHGGNVKLRQVIADQPAACPAAFVYSVLHTFAPTLARAEALRLEAQFKAKLGSRAFGLNAN